MKAKVKTILAFVLLLAFLLFPLSQQALADEGRHARERMLREIG